MPLVAYCKKCKAEVPVGESCCQCGGKLTKSAVRISFSYHHVLWRDWNCWNGILRIAGPVWLLVCMLVAVIEVAAKGWAALAALITSQTGVTLAIVALAGTILAGIGLFLAGREEQFFFLDSKGANLSTYLQKPGAVKLLLRGISPVRLREQDGAAEFGLFLSERQLAWTDIKRVQIWHDKNRILLYSPTWWMQMAVNCPADQFGEAVDYVVQKLAKRKDVKILHTPKEYESLARQ